MYQFQYLATRKGARYRLACFLIASALLGGCASQPAESPRAAASIEVFVRDAETELAKGNREQAVVLLTQGARSYPTSPVPWLRIANIWFEANNYPSAILAANEALQRDAASQEAKSLLVVSGLRVAAGAVANLRPAPAVGVTARSEAETLTNSLRAAIGEKTLVPAPPNDARTPPPASRPRARLPRQPVPAKESAASAPTSGSRSAGAASADPFKSLK